MNISPIAVDLAKNVFELAIADMGYRIRERQRLSRAQFERFIRSQPPSLFIMEACGGAHPWGRLMTSLGHQVRLLPARYVRAYVRRNKTDRADCAAILEAARAGDLHDVPIKTVEAQAVQILHRARSAWMATRTARINALRGLLREMGIVLAEGATRAIKRMRDLMADPEAALPANLRQLMQLWLGEIAAMEDCVAHVERELMAQAKRSEPVRHLQTVPGVGLLTSTATVAAVGKIEAFAGGREFAAWLGLTPREHSSGNRRRLGAITKQGNVYLRLLFTHGARAVLNAAKQHALQGTRLDRLQAWAVALERRVGHNKATVALANKIARIVWAVWRHERPYQAQPAVLV